MDLCSVVQKKQRFSSSQRIWLIPKVKQWCWIMIHLSLSLKHSTTTQKSAFFQELLYFLCLFIFERGDTTEKERRGEDIIFTKLNLFENILVYWNYENSKQADWGYSAVAVQSKKKLVKRRRGTVTIHQSMNSELIFFTCWTRAHFYTKLCSCPIAI